MQTVKLQKFIEDLDISPLEINENTFIDISKKNKKILSFNHEKGINEFKKILKIIRKSDDLKLLVNTINTQHEVTLDHKFFTKERNYISCREIFDEGLNYLHMLTISGEFEVITNIFLTKEKIPVFDLEIEDNHNLFTNGLLSHNSMGDPTTVSGGKAIPFYAHGRIRITRSEIDRENGQNVMKFTIIKNKMAPPFKVGTVIYKWGKGFDFFSEVGELAIEFGIIKNEKTSYFLPDLPELKLVGKKKVAAYLTDNPEYTKQVIEPLVKAYLDDTTSRTTETEENELY